jgi:hypothetical protein
MVSFRLSPEEYEAFQTICTDRGVRSLSDLARTAMQSMIAPPIVSPVSNLPTQLRSLSQEVNRLSVAIEARTSKQ